jgi:hypothetical protein
MKRFDLKDCWYTITLDKKYSHVLDFKAYQWAGANMDDTPIFEDKTDKKGVERTEDLEKALWFTEGGLKWDGCINLTFNAEVSHHECGITGFRQMAKMWEHLYRLAKEEMGSVWDGD